MEGDFELRNVAVDTENLTRGGAVEIVTTVFSAAPSL